VSGIEVTYGGLERASRATGAAGGALDHLAAPLAAMGSVEVADDGLHEAMARVAEVLEDGLAMLVVALHDDGRRLSRAATGYEAADAAAVPSGAIVTAAGFDAARFTPRPAAPGPAASGPAAPGPVMGPPAQGDRVPALAGAR
jgi:hypothetical protein